MDNSKVYLDVSGAGSTSLAHSTILLRNDIVPKATNSGQKGYTSRQLLIVFTYIYGNFFLSACVSLQAPFFPKEAELKGASPTEYGFVFAVYEFAIILVSPLVGKLVGKTSSRMWIQLGLLLTGVMTILFGFLDRAPYGSWFISLAFIVRILEGVGAASFTTPSYTAAAEEFPDDQATILSLLETSFGLGLICGPTLGGWLYEIGGFMMPFAILGSCLILGAVLNFGLTFNRESPAQDPKEEQAGYLKILFAPGIILDALCIVTSLSFIGYNATTLEPHLRQFDLSVMGVGSIFIITGTIYAITTPLWGKLCKFLDTRVMCLIGCILCVVGFIMIGPIPIIDAEPSLTLVITALVLIGLGTGIKLVSALVGSFQYAIQELGMPDNKSTFGVCSSIYHTSTSVGAFVGPSVGGFLLDKFGYRNGTYFLFTFELALIFGLLVFLINQCFRSNTNRMLYSGLEEQNYQDQEGQCQNEDQDMNQCP